MLLGIIMICSIFSYGVIILNSPPLVLPWSEADCEPDASEDEWCTLIMKPTFGWSWYLVLFTGLAVFFTGVILFFIDYFIPRWTAPIFHHSIVEADEEFIPGVCAFMDFIISFNRALNNYIGFKNYAKHYNCHNIFTALLNSPVVMLKYVHA